MQSNNQILNEAQKLYKDLGNCLDRFDHSCLKENSLFVNQQYELTIKQAWTRFSDSSDPLPPIREN